MGILEEAEAARERGLMLAREKLCFLFTSALDAGDLGTVAAIWQEAEQDTELEQMLIGIEEALHDEMEAQLGPGKPPTHCFICGGPLLPLPGMFCPSCDRR